MKKTLLVSCVAIFSIVSFVGCKKEEPAPPVPAAPAAETPPAVPAAQPPPRSQSAPPQDFDAAVFQRTIDYIQGRISAGDFKSAQASVATLESQSLTAAQRQTLDKVKAQIR